ncbi:hypothetical protein [Anaerorhabdus furcosa]|uniref:Uncharacterized protein n=1 Tax=Anaerorhabdus furcosa TaxID=118967 RepID=A0A1T4K327_9FIRM|nr:hypothetical protein [Anaerorhabdus furcosa]SJZ36841.1 hypothetical protein SAMN02745191_0270 [Anaerorhabdus furcosa]
MSKSNEQKKLTISIAEMAEELDISYTQSARKYREIKKKYNLNDSQLPKSGMIFRKYYEDFFDIHDEDYY